MQRLGIVIAAVVVLAGCGGAHSVVPNMTPPRSAGATQAAVFTITVPKAASAQARRPAYISPATQSIAIGVYDSKHTTLLSAANQNITVGAPGCTTPTPISPLTCAITLPLSPGSYTFDFTTYDGPLSGGSPTGSKLSANLDVPFTIVAGTANNIGVSLGGIASSVILAPSATAAFSGTNSTGYTLTGCGSTQIVSAFGVDADGNYILGSGAPTMSVSSDTPSAITTAALGPASPNAFSINCLTPFTSAVHLTATATAQSGTGTAATNAVIPLMLQLGESLTGTITEYGVPTSGSLPQGITAGPDGALWFAEQNGNKIGRITMSGAITEYSVPTSSSRPLGITAGPDGALWFTEQNGNKIGRITTSGAITEYSVPTSSSDPDGITAGPDGALWFTEYASGKIGRITTSGAITEYSVPTSGSEPLYITAGPDGALWFTEYYSGKIGRITTSGAITEYSVPTSSPFPVSITAGPDGALWFTEFGGNKIGRVTTSGAITEYSVPTSSSYPGIITAGPDGALWFTEHDGNNIGRITTAGAITEYNVPTSSSGPEGITAAPNGALWFTEFASNKIGQLK